MHQITLPYPTQKLWPNRGASRMQLARLKKSYRFDCGIIAQHYCRKHGIEPMEFADIQVHLYHKGNRKPDEDNATAALKAAFDGLVDGGFFTDDMQLSHQRMKFTRDPSDPRVVVEIREREDDQ